MTRLSTKEAMKQALKDMKKAGLHPYSLFKEEKLIKQRPDPAIRLGLVGL